MITGMNHQMSARLKELASHITVVNIPLFHTSYTGRFVLIHSMLMFIVLSVVVCSVITLSQMSHVHVKYK